jgi:adenine-specific DNA-methyltransferase
VDYYAEFGSPKIIYPHFNVELRFTYDRDGFLSNDKTYIIPGGSRFLLGILNSKIAEFFLQQICPAVRGGYLELRTPYVKQIPVATPADVHREAIEAVVRKLLAAEGEEPHVKEWERELNALVYEVYGLTEEEIAIVEEETTSDIGNTR